MRSRLLALLGLVLIGGSYADESMDSDRVREVVRDMQWVSTWYHDDLFGEYAGFWRYERKQYKEALRNFELGALYADKPSQLSIGFLYLNGEGVQKDAATALAWFDLAAERRYPMYVATRDRLSTTLSVGELTRSAEIRSQLSKKYGDAVAKPRLAAELREGIGKKLGSRTGGDSSVRVTSADALFRHGVGPYGIGACPGGFWSEVCWNPDLYCAMRDKELSATVTVGPVTIPEKQK